MFIIFGGRGAAPAAISGLLLACGGGGLAMFLWAALANIVAARGNDGRMGRAASAFAIVTSAIKLASAFAVLIVCQILLRMDYHSVKVTTSFQFLAAMAGAPLVGALICLVIGVKRRPLAV